MKTIEHAQSLGGVQCMSPCWRLQACGKCHQPQVISWTNLSVAATAAVW